MVRRNGRLFEFVDTVVIPATGKVVARDKIIVDTSEKVEVKIAWLGTTLANNPFGSWSS